MSMALLAVRMGVENTGFTGSLTLEIEDLNFGRVLSAEEKIAVLARDAAFMHECME